MPSRRRVLASGASLLAVGVAGCSSSTTETSPADDESTQTGNTAQSETESKATTEDDSYTVTVEPNPPHTFESVPETYAVIPSVWMDIGMALGKQPSATASLDRAPLKYYEHLPDVSFDPDSVTKLASSAEEGFDKENFYAADVDVHLIDPRSLKFYANWSDADIEEISNATGPFLGSTIRFASSSINEHEPYYDLYGAFEKAGQIFQRQARFRAWQSLYDEFISNIESKLPPKSERPTVAAIWRGVNPDSGTFRISPIHAKQNNTRTYRVLGLKDAFEGQIPDGPIGYEKLLDIDPDYIGAVGGLTSLTHDEFVSTVVEPFENNSNGQELTAVKEGNLVRTGGQFMGPIVDLYSTEALAKQVFPEAFGEWPGALGSVPEDEQLFDRQRVADIINGDL
ncbi:ABC transporter substrate-binding protein [Halogeometricum borinquense]|uniref:ABC transporter substrate-binding protein n=1 Tax=Halogeometricum borinquense TaxID=60847 RepID=A0A482TPQ0_9EURY|nr:ABC transporter substrate-binding protein [Halogeometricum borinquense]RYJ15221.1 ABC transporter substrate-binding protein [Halogeometricum borinquense]